MSAKKWVFGGMVFLLAGFSFGQWYGYRSTAEGSEFDGGLGMSWIDNQAYYQISFQPDIAMGKFGFGLNINLLYNAENGKFYSQEWKNRRTGKTDYLRIFRYVRYGRKGDPLYAQVGALDAARLGHGFIFNFYNNQIAYEDRKIGLSLDMDFGLFGFESVTNNLARMEVIGARAYVRPLHQSEIPVLKRLAFGASVVKDVDPDSRRSTEDDAVTVWGVDAELPLIKSQILTTLLYADHAKIQDYGSGQTIGLRTDFSALWGFLGLNFNIERRFMGKEFIAPYFGPFYEILRYATIGEVIDFYSSIGGDISGIPSDFLPIISNIPVNQKMLLPMMMEKRNAWYAGLDLNFFKLIRVLGFYQRVDNYKNSGTLHLGAGLSQNIPYFTMEATYDKRGIETFKDIRTLDVRSVARVGIGYKVKPYLLLYMDYIWNFVWDEAEGQYVPQERVQPRIALRYPFSL